MDMIDTSDAEGFVAGLAAATELPGWRSRQFGRSALALHRPTDVASEAAELASIGLLGVLPFAKHPDGDQIALLATPGEPVSEWPVLRCSHSNGVAAAIAHRLSEFPAVHVVKRRRAVADARKAVVSKASIFP
jgi:hypothetical protein